jgi:hypothetical protein
MAPPFVLTLLKLSSIIIINSIAIFVFVFMRFGSVDVVSTLVWPELLSLGTG